MGDFPKLHGMQAKMLKRHKNKIRVFYGCKCTNVLEDGRHYTCFNNSLIDSPQRIQFQVKRAFKVKGEGHKYHNKTNPILVGSQACQM